MGRPPHTGPPRRRVTLHLPTDLADRLAVAADERTLSSSVLATYALEDYLERLVPVEEARRRFVR